MRDWIRLDDAGGFRPLRAAPNLPRGRVYHAPDLPGLHAALDYLYPAEWANWLLWRAGKLASTPWRETAERQTGRFRIVREIDEPALAGLVAAHCVPGCLKKRLWASASEKVAPVPGEIALLCPEACNFLVGHAREKLKGPGGPDAL